VARSTGESAALDALDREILGHLVNNARISYRELGDRVSLSANATAERVRRLREAGVISGFRAVLDPGAAGRNLVALIDVRLEGPGETGRFERLLQSVEEITDAAHVTGRFDYQLRVACHDVADLDAIIRTLKTKGGVVETDTRLALRTVVSREAPVPG
jgi:Lrp/AsnC family transcriptional regulator, leucine-responsive regulatory protein